MENARWPETDIKFALEDRAGRDLDVRFHDIPGFGAGAGHSRIRSRGFGQAGEAVELAVATWAMECDHLTTGAFARNVAGPRLHITHLAERIA